MDKEIQGGFDRGGFDSTLVESIGVATDDSICLVHAIHGSTSSSAYRPATSKICDRNPMNMVIWSYGE